MSQIASPVSDERMTIVSPIKTNDQGYFTGDVGQTLSHPSSNNLSQSNIEYDQTPAYSQNKLRNVPRLGSPDEFDLHIALRQKQSLTRLNQIASPYSPERVTVFESIHSAQSNQRYNKFTQEQQVTQSHDQNTSQESSLNKDLADDDIVYIQAPQRTQQQRPMQVRPVEYPMASRRHLLQTSINDLKAYEAQVNKKLNQLRVQTQQKQFQNVFSTLKHKPGAGSKFDQYKIRQKGRPLRNSMQVNKMQDPKINKNLPKEQLGKEINDQMQFIQQVQSFKSQVSNYEQQYQQNLILQSIRSRKTVQSSQQQQSMANTFSQMGRGSAFQDSLKNSLALIQNQKPSVEGNRVNNSSLMPSSVKSNLSQKQAQAAQYDSMLDNKVLNKAIRLIQTPEMILEESTTKIEKETKKDPLSASSSKSSESLDTDYKQDREKEVTLSISSNFKEQRSALKDTDPQMEIKRGRYQLPVILTKQISSDDNVQRENENQNMQTLTDDDLNTPIRTSMISPQNSKMRRMIGENSELRQSFMQFRDLKISEQHNQQSIPASRVESIQKFNNRLVSDSQMKESNQLRVPNSSLPKQSVKIISIQNKVDNEGSSKSRVTFSDDFKPLSTKIILDLPQKFNKRNFQVDHTPVIDVDAWHEKLSSPKFNHYSLSANKRKEVLTDGSMQKETTKKTIKRVVSNESSRNESHTKMARISPEREIYQTIHRSPIIKGFDIDQLSQHEQPDGINKITIKNQPKQDDLKEFQTQDETLTLRSHHSPHFDLRVTDKLDTYIKNYQLKNKFDSKFNFVIENEFQDAQQGKDQNTDLVDQNLGRLYEGHKLKPAQSLIYRHNTHYKHNLSQNQRQRVNGKDRFKQLKGSLINTSVTVVQGAKILPPFQNQSKFKNDDISQELAIKQSKYDAKINGKQTIQPFSSKRDGNILENDKAFQICFSRFQQTKNVIQDGSRSTSGSPRLPFLSPLNQARASKKRNEMIKSIDFSDRMTRDLMIDTSEPLYQILQPKSNQFPSQTQSKKKGLRGGVNGRDSKQIESFLSYFISNQIQ